MEGGGRKRSAEGEDGDDAARKRLGSGREERVEGETVIAVPGMSRDVAQRRTPSADHTAALPKVTGSAKRKAASTTKDDGDPGLPLTPQSQTSTPETAAPRHDATKATSVPTYTMPYKFYLTAAESRPPPPAATGKRPARTVQTTLNLSTKQPFKECKLCDTVFNPLHAADVRLHQARHARMVGGGRKK